MPLSIRDIAEHLKGTIIGNDAIIIEHISSIENIKPNSIVFAEHNDAFLKAEDSAALAIIVNHDVNTSKKTLIQVPHPFGAFIMLMNLMHPTPKPLAGVHKTAILEEGVTCEEGASIGAYAVIEKGTKIGKGTHIKAHVTIGQNVIIGDDCVIHPHVTIYDNTRIDNRVTIHAGSVLGSDGFGYKFLNGKHVKVPHIGYVHIQDDVEVGANTTIDRGSIDATVIGMGTKIDNLIQIAHSVQLGKHNILCAFTGIAGSTVSGDHVVFAANVGVSDHVIIEDGVILGARTGVPPKKRLKSGQVYLGSPARPRERALELELSSTRIPIMSRKLRELSERVQKLEQHSPKGE